MDLVPKVKTLEELFSGLRTKYTVPDYQRDYSWRQENIETLWRDITVSQESNDEYFMGPLVLNKEANKPDEFEIIDGQQRLATFSVLFSVLRAISNRFIENPADPAFAGLAHDKQTEGKAKRIRDLAGDRLLHRSEPDHYFMSLNRKDREYFTSSIIQDTEALLTDKQLRVLGRDPRLLKTRKFFSKNIRDQFLTKPNGMAELHDCLTHVMFHMKFLAIEVKSDLDAYLLFESLNSKSLDLSIADLIKNRMLMTCGKDDQLKVSVLDNWEKMTATLENSRYSATDFLRFYWQAYEKSAVTNKALYKEMRAKLTATSVGDYSQRLATSAQAFTEMTHRDLCFPSAQRKPDTTEWVLSELNSLGYSVCYPLLLWVKQDRPESLDRLARRSLSFLFRLVTVGDISVGRAEKAFGDAMKALKDGQSDDDAMKHLFDKEITNQRFIERFRTRRYEDNSVAKYILTKLDIYDNGVGKVPNLQYTNLEHILPVENSKWADFDTKGQGWEPWTYSIGNMTLFERPLNQTVSNGPFAKKIPFYRRRTGNDETGTTIPMTCALYEEYQQGRKKWTADRITARAKKFAKNAASIWPL